MRELSATDVKQGFGSALDEAQRGPVLIKKQNRAVAVLLSVQEYDKLRGLRLTAFERLCDEIAAKAAARGLDDETFEALMEDVS